MLVLGIETSCDETSCAVVQEGKFILSHIISSQADMHALYGGVVPELACRKHIEMLFPVIDEALQKSGKTLKEMDLIAATKGPGLIGALLIGLNCAKALSLATKKPLVGINHIEAHLYAAFMEQCSLPSFPCLGAVLSGGHTAILEIKSIGNYGLIGQTVDDAIGEAFDKVSKLLGLGYPGGPLVEALAKEGDPNRFPLKSGTVKGAPYSFSFSGLKTGVLYAVKELPQPLSLQDKRDLAASFQQAAFKDVLQKIEKISQLTGLNCLALGGGVTASRTLRTLFAEKLPHLKCFWPSFNLSIDNGAMIAGLGYHQYLLKGPDSLDMDAIPTLPW